MQQVDVAFPEALYLVIEAYLVRSACESAQRRWRVAVEVRYTCIVGLRRSLARHLEGPYPFHLSQVSCSKLMTFPEALYLVIEALASRPSAGGVSLSKYATHASSV